MSQNRMKVISDRNNAFESVGIALPYNRSRLFTVVKTFDGCDVFVPCVNEDSIEHTKHQLQEYMIAQKLKYAVE